MPAEWCDGFLQLVKSGQPVVGESTDIDYPESIEILSFKFGTMSGFSDTDEFYAVQKVGERGNVAASRAQENDGSVGLASLFGGEDSAPEYSDKELKQYQGKDLSEVEACKFQIVKEMDISTPDLFRAYCSAQDLEHRDVFDSATITLRKATGKTRAAFLTYTFNDLVVVGYSFEIGGDASPKETITMSFGKIRAEYRPQLATGAMGKVIKGGWDFIERSTW
ncbi:MAG TPA: type VI secretion system tube protein Hcp [Pirellulales bacterium]|nr:type VI secretion system tube protein Hcp [Pirellulales bacterium]